MTHVRSGPGVTPRSPVTKDWIIEFHDAWSRVTLSSFYSRVERSSLSAPQYAQWAQDRARVAHAVAAAAERTAAGPLAKLAAADAAWFGELARATDARPGRPLEGQDAVRGVVDRLVRLIDEATAVPAPRIVGLAVLWAYMFVDYQAWSLSQSRVAALPGRFRSVSDHVLRDGAIEGLIHTQDVLDMLLADTKGAGIEKAKSAFEDVLKLVNDILDQTLYIGEQGQAPLCVCGRKGHLPAQCTFKSHI